MTVAWIAPLRVRTLMAITAIVAVALWLILVVPSPVGFLGFWGLAMMSLPGVIHRGRLDPPRRRDALLFPAMLALAVGAEGWAANLSYFTLGEIHQVFFILAIGLNVPAVGLLLGRRRRWSYAWLAALALWLVPCQLLLLAKWTVLDREARAVIALALAREASDGHFPDDLRGDHTGWPLARQWVYYEPDPAHGFRVWYHLGATSTHHSYRPDQGWFYYPD